MTVPLAILRSLHILWLLAARSQQCRGAPLFAHDMIPCPAKCVSPKPRCRLTFFGRRRVTRVMPWMRVRCSFSMALRAFFSLREWMTAVEPAGRLESPASISESELSSSAPSSTETFLVGSSSGSSSTLGLAIFATVFCFCKVGEGWSAQSKLGRAAGSSGRGRQRRSLPQNSIRQNPTQCRKPLGRRRFPVDDCRGSPGPTVAKIA